MRPGAGTVRAKLRDGLHPLFPNGTSVRLAKRAYLYLIPLIAVVTARYFVVHAAWPSTVGWGPRHGIAQSIAHNYLWINAIPLCGWPVVSFLVLFRKNLAACVLATFLAGFLACDVVMYLPMAQISGEGFPYDQVLYFALLGSYALFLTRRAASGEVADAKAGTTQLSPSPFPNLASSDSRFSEAA